MSSINKVSSTGPSQVNPVVAETVSALDKTIAQMTQILLKNPDNLHAKVSRGCLYAKQEKWIEALCDFNALLYGSPKNKDLLLAYHERGKYFFGQKQYERANKDIQVAEEIIEDYSEDVLEEKKTQIYQLREEINKVHHKTVPRQLASGGIGKNWADMTAYLEMTKRSEELTANSIAAGKALKEQCDGDIHKLSRCLIDNLEIARNNFPLRLLRVKALMSEDKNFFVAIEELNAIIEANEKDVCSINPDLFHMRAVAYFYTDQFEKAIEDISKACKIAPDCMLYQMIYYQLLYRVDEVKEARERLRKAYERSPTEFFKHQSYVSEEDLKLLGEYIASLQENTLRSAALCCLFGNWELATEKYEKIKEHSAETAPEYLQAVIGLVKCKWEERNEKAVQEYFEIAWKINPEDPTVKEIKAAIDILINSLKKDELIK